MRRITKTLIWIGVGGVLYFIANHHFVYFGGKTVRLLKKKEITFSRTFFSCSLKTNAMILEDDVLREAGIADLLVDEGLMSEKERDKLLDRYEKGEYE